MTDIRANWDPHDGQGRSPDRRERDQQALAGLTLALLGVAACLAFVGVYYFLEKAFGA